MTKADIGLVDLFAGPGGLGEGFRAAGRDRRTRTILSVENDPRAFETLRLRACLHMDGDQSPQAYRRALDAGTALPDFAITDPARWRAACDETLMATLGEEKTFAHMAPRLDSARETLSGHTILIGGPPCQAYSLVGRARNRGVAGYDPDDDNRHFLYREYIRVLERLKPAAFVMENVKGILSSSTGAGKVISRVMEDLSKAGDGYTLVPLIGASDALFSKPSDFVVRAEDHGVPQARHRVFLVGFRSDIPVPQGALLERTMPRPTVARTLAGLPPLRSGLSKGDSADAWSVEVREAAATIMTDHETPGAVAARMHELLENGLGDLRERNGAILHAPQDDEGCALAHWLGARRPRRILQHETRGHIPTDLARYLYAAAFAEARGASPKLADFPEVLQPRHANRATGVFADRFRVQVADRPSSTITSHISKDGHYYIHPDPIQVRSLTVREAARLQTFPDDYLFMGPRTEQYRQVGNAVPPFLAMQIGKAVLSVLDECGRS